MSWVGLPFVVLHFWVFRCWEEFRFGDGGSCVFNMSEVKANRLRKKNIKGLSFERSNGSWVY